MQLVYHIISYDVSSNEKTRMQCILPLHAYDTMSSVKERRDTTQFDRLWPKFTVKFGNVIIIFSNFSMNLDRHRVFVLFCL